MSTLHQLPEKNLNVTLANKTLERVSETKLLGIHFDEHLTWNKHINTVIYSCHYTLSTLHNLKNFKTSKLRNNLLNHWYYQKLILMILRTIQSPKNKQKSCEESN